MTTLPIETVAHDNQSRPHSRRTQNTRNATIVAGESGSYARADSCDTYIFPSLAGMALGGRSSEVPFAASASGFRAMGPPTVLPTRNVGLEPAGARAPWATGGASAPTTLPTSLPMFTPTANDRMRTPDSPRR
jgi:hypothetical protein